jgi:hypothetical protein
VSPAYGALPHYVLVIEGAGEAASAGAAADAFDRALSSNVNYAFYRATGLVRPPRVEIVTPGTFAAWRLKESAAGVGSWSQQKHRTVVSPEQFAAIRDLSRELGAARRG